MSLWCLLRETNALTKSFGRVSRGFYSQGLRYTIEIIFFSREKIEKIGIWFIQIVNFSIISNSFLSSHLRAFIYNFINENRADVCRGKKHTSSLSIVCSCTMFLVIFLPFQFFSSLKILEFFVSFFFLL